MSQLPPFEGGRQDTVVTAPCSSKEPRGRDAIFRRISRKKIGHQPKGVAGEQDMDYIHNVIPSLDTHRPMLCECFGFLCPRKSYKWEWTWQIRETRTKRSSNYCLTQRSSLCYQGGGNWAFLLLFLANGKSKSQMPALKRTTASNWRSNSENTTRG